MSELSRVQSGGGEAKDQSEHEAAMIAKAEEGVTSISAKDGRTDDEPLNLKSEPSGEPDATARPDSIPEKFWDAEKGEVNVEALLKAQQDAEKALRQQQNEDKTEDQSDSDETPAEETQTAQDNVVEAASVEFAEKGELSDDTFAALEKVGISRDMTESYIAGQLAVVEKLQHAVYGPFDGADGYEAAANWAAENLSETEIQALDVQLTSTNPAIAAEGAKALAAKYSANADIEPTNTISGSGNQTTSGARYASGAQMRADMADPRYKSDPAFRAEVSEKIRKSDVDLFA